MKTWQHLKTVTKHRWLVLKGCFRVGLYGQGLTHDLSKYSPTEFWIGAKYYQGTRSPNAAEREDKGKAYERYTVPQNLVGKVITTNVPAGTVLHSGMVKEQILIQPYSQVNICTNVNGVEIKTDGTALERGRRGDYIMVQNISSKRKVRAKVIDENNVQVAA